jgi:hypothetical protein
MSKLSNFAKKHKTAIVIGVSLASAVLVVAVVVIVILLSKKISGSKPVIKGKGSTVKLAVKETPASVQARSVRGKVLGATTNPVYIGLKFGSVYLAEQINEDQSNSGQTQMIWLNDQCQGNIGNCDVDPGEKDITITNFFDFTRPSEEVNAQLNSQDMLIQPGTYKFLRMEFCRRGPNSTSEQVANQSDNIRYQIEGMDEPFGFKMNMCNVTVPLDPPLVATGNESFTLTLNYDFSNIVTTFDAPVDSYNCTQTAPYSCLGQIEFVPSITVNTA